MRKRMFGAFALVAMMLTLSSPSPAFGRHPEIEDALRSLDRAKMHLEKAAHDFGGHRVDAIRAIDEAERQLNLCLQY